MSKDPSKPKPDAKLGAVAPTPKRRSPATGNVSGRVKHDDRGNAIWEWAVTTALTDDSPTSRLRKLEHPALSLAEDAPTPFDGVKENRHGIIKGYSPYDSGLLAKKDKPRKRKDLRKLGEWMKMRKQSGADTPEKG